MSVPHLITRSSCRVLFFHLFPRKDIKVLPEMGLSAAQSMKRVYKGFFFVGGEGVVTNKVSFNVGAPFTNVPPSKPRFEADTCCVTEILNN